MNNTENNTWNTALAYAAATVVLPAAIILLASPAVALVLTPAAVALPFFSMALLEANLGATA